MFPKIYLPIQGGFLCPLSELHVSEQYVSGLNDPEVNQFLEVRHQVQSYNSVINFVKENIASPRMILWGVWQGQSRSEVLVGTARLYDIDFERLSCYFGICLFDKSIWGNGIGPEVIRALTQWAFNFLGLTTIRAGVLLANIGSQRAFRKAGYKQSENCEVGFRVHDSENKGIFFTATRETPNKLEP